MLRVIQTLNKLKESIKNGESREEILKTLDVIINNACKYL